MSAARKLPRRRGRKVSRRERLAVTDEVTQDLLPRAFSRSSSIRAIIAGSGRLDLDRQQ
jgi:DNA recombination-dependent growth factor C